MKFTSLLLMSVFFSGVSSIWADEPGADPALAEKAYNVLKERCARCHGGSAVQAGIDVLSLENLTLERGPSGGTFYFVKPGDVTSSQLVDAVEGGEESYMPKAGSPEAKAMTQEEKDLIREWVAAGAPFPRRRDVPFVSQKQVLTSVRDYLLKVKSDDRRYQRFYSFAHLVNNESLTVLDLRMYKAALSKVVNSLSKERDIYLPQTIPGSSEAVFVIDLRKLGWDRRHLWDLLLKQYPYGLKYDFVKDEELQELSKDVAKFAEGEQPILRADWFIITATQPPLYHEFLEIPDTLMDLEHQLQLSLEDNFIQGRLQRAGYAKSGVSMQNRLLERHESPATPYFWISYDFLPRRTKGDLARFPLGPVFERNRFPHQAFEQDGGEIIWSLPNGMQAYMLVRADGGRIDAGPIEVVFDRSAILGTPSIINGISCMYCHRAGMITEFRDEIRDADAVGGDARNKVLELYPKHEDMQKLVLQDQDLFVRALEKTIGPYLKVGADAQKSVLDFPEPVGKVAELYSRDLTPRELALELDIQKPDVLQAKIEANRELLRYGLGTMIQNPPGTLKREKWESRDGTSLMQDVAAELRLGTPVIP
ncbi:MAG: c-type cytochrome domain-containing protein [Planctomycetota bacterium]